MKMTEVDFKDLRAVLVIYHKDEILNSTGSIVLEPHVLSDEEQEFMHMNSMSLIKTQYGVLALKAKATLSILEIK